MTWRFWFKTKLWRFLYTTKEKCSHTILLKDSFSEVRSKLNFVPYLRNIIYRFYEDITAPLKKIACGFNVFGHMYGNLIFIRFGKCQYYWIQRTETKCCYSYYHKTIMFWLPIIVEFDIIVLNGDHKYRTVKSLKARDG